MAVRAQQPGRARRPQGKEPVWGLHGGETYAWRELVSGWSAARRQRSPHPVGIREGIVTGPRGQSGHPRSHPRALDASPAQVSACAPPQPPQSCRWGWGPNPWSNTVSVRRHSGRSVSPLCVGNRDKLSTPPPAASDGAPRGLVRPAAPQGGLSHLPPPLP